MTPVKTRFAPSPTGSLHIGGARTAFFNWIVARKFGGKFILRIDDTDKERSSKEYENEIIESMKWLGLDWDEGPFRQSERIERYKYVVERLLDEGSAYRCYCTPQELEEYRRLAIQRKFKPMYPKTCRNKNVKDNSKQPAIRFKVPEDILTVEFEDDVVGKVRFNTSEIEDFVILRSDGVPTYNLCTVVDDLDFSITHIIRGEDHISNTPKQILLYRALKSSDKIPVFAHIPLIFGLDVDEKTGKASIDEKTGSARKSRLSKRLHSVSVSDYRRDGFIKEALLNHFARLGWAYGDKEIFSVSEILELFSIKDINRTPSAFSYDKLLWLNSEWMKILSNDELANRLSEYSNSNKLEINQKLLEMIKLSKIRTKTLRELYEMVIPFFEVKQYDSDGVRKFFNEKGKYCLKRLKTIVEEIPGKEIGRKYFEEGIKKLASETNEKTVFVAQVLRLALFGKLVSPPLFDSIQIIGKEESVLRIERAISAIT